MTLQDLVKDYGEILSAEEILQAFQKLQAYAKK